MGCFDCFTASSSSKDRVPLNKAQISEEISSSPKITPSSISAEPLTPPGVQKAKQPPLPALPPLKVQPQVKELQESGQDEAEEDDEAASSPRPVKSLADSTPIAAQTFSFRELERATRGFAQSNFIGEGGFGRVYKGRLESTGQQVAVKQLDRSGLQGNREFLVEVLMLSLLHHPHLVSLLGYCADGDQRLLVYELMRNGALEDHLHDLPEGREPLDWNIRMKVAAGAARGLEYLHDKANPPVIYRDFKSSNILLDETWHPKLSDFGLAKLGPTGDKTHVSTRVMGTYGYCAPEYAMTGQLTLKSDVYSFGVVLLELITGRKAIDNTRSQGEHNLVAWARPLFKDRRKFPAMADPLLRGRYPMRGLYQALAVAAMCLQEQAPARPVIADVVTALSYLAAQIYDPNTTPATRFGPNALVGGERERRELRGGRGPPGMRNSPRNSPDLRPQRGDGPIERMMKSKKDGFDDRSSSPTTARGYRESPPHRPGRLAPQAQKGGAQQEPRGYGESWRDRRADSSDSEGRVTRS
eukprot:jgi/Mesen1/10207/ME000077S09543